MSRHSSFPTLPISTGNPIPTVGNDPFFKPTPNKKYYRCQACNGTGYELQMGQETCPDCAGTGRDKTSDLWAEPCRKCNGKGKVTYCRRGTTPCSVCKGRKVIEY